MIETRRLKNVVIFIQTILSFVLSRKIILEIFHEFFIICDLSNNSNETQVWKIFNIALDYSVIYSLSLARKIIMQGMRYE